MLIENQIIKTKWVKSNYEWYISKNYVFTKFNKPLFVKAEDLTLSSDVRIKVKCDYCEETIDKQYKEYINSRVKSPIQKDCCSECKHLKVEESNLLIYGVKSTNSLQETLDKRFETNNRKYGAITPSKNKEIQLKIRETMNEKYGVNAPIQNNQIKDKIKNTNIERYGTENVFASEEVKQRIKENNLIRIGVEHHTQLDEYWDVYKDSMIRLYGVDHPSKSEEIRAKTRETMYKNNTVPCSLQQVYICELLSGELNYPVNTSSLDIAFPEEKIYIEFHGSGHWLSVDIGTKTIEQFENDERNRRYALYRRGWKEITIISRKDKIPTDEKIKEMSDYAKDHLKEHSWIKFDIDNLTVETSLGIIDYSYGELKSYYKFRKEIDV